MLALQYNRNSFKCVFAPLTVRHFIGSTWIGLFISHTFYPKLACEWIYLLILLCTLLMFGPPGEYFTLPNSLRILQLRVFLLLSFSLFFTHLRKVNEREILYSINHIVPNITNIIFSIFLINLKFDTIKWHYIII